jgi:RNA polymerase sigma factor (TIGR02999 family)
VAAVENPTPPSRSDPADAGRTTRLLNRLGRGDRAAEAELLDALYDELHVLAQGYMERQRAGHTLQATALVHEAWMRVSLQEAPSFDGRRQFFALASRAMRAVLVDHARARQASKREAHANAVRLEGVDAVAGAMADDGQLDLVALDGALERLGEIDADLLRLVELRFFGGLSQEEIAELQGVSARTVQRSWRAARAWLHRALSP